jgi:DNA mismatch endonuclease (patch repair protein)
MADIVTPAVRSRMMSGIRGKNTRPELVVRRLLHAAGFRYRLHDKRLPGKPDLVFPKYRAAVFVHGCFWHGHDCHLFKIPKTREDFWRIKIAGNIKRDQEASELLSSKGWRVGVIWECALKGKTRLDLDSIVRTASAWLKSSESEVELRGHTT